MGFNEVARPAPTYDRYVATHANDIDYVAVAAYGPRSRITALTKRLACYAAEMPVTAHSGKDRWKAGLLPTVEDCQFTTRQRQRTADIARRLWLRQQNALAVS